MTRTRLSSPGIGTVMQRMAFSTFLLGAISHLSTAPTSAETLETKPIDRKQEAPQEPSTPAAQFGEAVRSSEPLSPKAELAGFHVPPGFVVELVASEPEIAKPLNLAFDSRGRLWVTQTVEYPYPAKDEQSSRDQVRILEDRDGDGFRETATVFAENVNIPIGLLPYEDGCFCFSIPNLYRMRDSNGDGKCDTREVVLGPFDTTRDTHGMVNSLRLGIDGWIYANHGYNNQSTIQGKDGKKVSMSSGNTFRFLPDGSKAELFTQGQVNPFGSVEDDWGTIFTADCHSKPITQLVWGGCYPSFGRPDDGLGFVPSTMEHLHGSTAIAGISIGTGPTFPANFRDNFFSGNVMTSRINRNQIVRKGATVQAVELPDFLTSDDPWFRPVDIVLGPDGALYVADFYNKVIGHYEVPLNHPGRDRDRGRIFRVRYVGDAKAAKSNPSTQTSELDRGNSLPLTLRRLASENPQVRRDALQRIVQHHANEAIPLLQRELESATSSWAKIGAIWGLARIQKSFPANQRLAIDKDPLVRNHLALAATEFAKPDAIPFLRSWLERESSDPVNNAMVLRSLVECMGVHGDAADVRPLIKILSSSEKDPVLAQTTKIALRRILLKPMVADTVTGGWGKDNSAVKSSAAIPIEGPEASELIPILIAMKDKMPFEATMAWMLQPGNDPSAFREILPRIATSVSLEKSKNFLPILSKYYGADPAIYSDLLLSISNAQKLTYGRVAVEVEQAGVQLIQDWMEALSKQASDSLPVLSWHASGTTSQLWPVERRKVQGENDDEIFYSSLGLDEEYVGTWESAPFAPPKELTFWIVGHNGFPGQPDHHRNRVQLVRTATNEVLREAFPPRSDIAEKIVWNLSDIPVGNGNDPNGELVQLRCVDGDAGEAYAWMGIGRISLASLSPSGPNQALEQMVKLAASFNTARARFQDNWNQEKNLDADWRGRIASASIRQDRSLSAALLEYASKRGWVSEIQGSTESLKRLSWNPSDWSDELEGALFQQVTKHCSAIQQREVVRLLATKREWWPSLALGIERGWLGTEGLVKQNQAWWNSLPDDETGEKLRAFKPSDAAAAEALMKLVEQRTNALQSTVPNVAQGQIVFKEKCSLCHQLNGQGTVLGPQLEGVGGRGLSRLAEDILQPNRNIDEAFRMTSFVLDDGEVVQGLVRQRTDEVITLANQKGENFTIPVANVEREKKSDISLMPSNFGEVLSDQQLSDLIGFLRKQAEKK